MNYDVVIVGGGPAGSVTAITARQNYPDKSILVIRSVEKPVIPCAIPYIFGRLRGVEDIISSSDAALKGNNIDLLIDTVVSIDSKNQQIKTKAGETIGYSKLVLATGALPSSPPIKGIDLKNVFSIYKDNKYLEEMLEIIRGSSSIGIIGGGFVGAEIADELSRTKEVHLFEILPHILQLNFDEEFCKMAEEELRKKGVHVHTGTKVLEIAGNTKVEKVKLENGTEVNVDAVIIATGTKPNVELAKRAGLTLGETGAIKIDEYMRTSDKNIFAVGDCAEKKFYLTSKPVQMMLASIATAEARIAGFNLFDLRFVNQIKGAIGIFSTKIGDLVLACAGLTERNARLEGFDIVVGYSEAFDKHPAKFSETHKVTCKLIVSRRGELILGAEIAGGDSVGEMINLAGFAIENQVTVSKMINLQIGTHPLLTPPPTATPIILAALDALRKLRG